VYKLEFEHTLITYTLSLIMLKFEYLPYCFHRPTLNYKCFHWKNSNFKPRKLRLGKFKEVFIL